MPLPGLARRMLRQYTHTTLSGGKDRFGYAVHDEVGVAADGRGEVGVAGRGQGEMAFVLFAVARLAQGTEHEVGKDALLWLAGYLERQLLIHAGGNGDVCGNRILARLMTPAGRAASLLAALRLHGHAFHRQRAKTEGVAKGSRYSFEFSYASRFRLFVDSIQRWYVEVLQPGSDALVGRDHELFDQTIGPAALGTNDALHGAAGIKFNDRLGQVEIDRSAALALAMQQAREFVHPFEIR